MPDQALVAWIAGLLEGEGTFDLANKITPRIRIVMTDLDVMIKAAQVLGAPSVNATKRPTRGNKTAYYLAVHGDMAISWMLKVYDFMGDRRKQAILRCIDLWKEKQSWTGRRRQSPKPGPRLSSPRVAWVNSSSKLARREQDA